MGYFPFFLELSAQAGLVVGGGRVALRKVEKLLPYGPRLTVVATALRDELRMLAGITCLERPFAPSDLEGVAFAVAATDDGALNRRICALCREKHILVNSVDGREEGAFLFPALVQRGPLSVGISTGGTSPSAAAWLKEEIAALLPERLEDILLDLDALRETLQARVPEAGLRARFHAALCHAALAAGRVLTEDEKEGLLQGICSRQEEER